MTKILLSTESDIKVDVIKYIFPSAIINSISVSGGTEQPFNYTNFIPPNINQTIKNCVPVRHSLECAWFRHNELLKHSSLLEYDMAISIESGIVYDNEVMWNLTPTYYDVVDVIITEINPNGTLKHYTTLNIPFDKLIKVPVPLSESMRLKEIYGNKSSTDIKTVGEQISETYQLFKDDGKIYSSKNWMKHFGIDRHAQIKLSVDYVLNMTSRNLSNIIDSLVVKTPNFPEKGVLFQDYQYVFGHPEIKKYLSHYYCRNIINSTTENTSKFVIVGPELRGYFGTCIADVLGCEHIMVRKGIDGKPTKMGNGIEKEYIKEKEYSEGNVTDGNVTREFLYCRPEFIKDKYVILFDDVLATGGSIEAVYRLVEKCGGNVIKMCFLADVPELRQKAQSKLENKNIQIDIAFECTKQLI